MSIREDAQKTLDRWPEWNPTVRFYKVGRIRIEGSWVGPLGGGHTTRAWSRRGVVREILWELARWQRKHERAYKKRAKRAWRREAIKLREVLR